MNNEKFIRNRVFDCHLSPDWRQMAIKNNVSNDFSSIFALVKSIFVCRLSSVNNSGHLIDKELTLKAPITTAADDKFCDNFPNFRQK